MKEWIAAANGKVMAGFGVGLRKWIASANGKAMMGRDICGEVGCFVFFKVRNGRRKVCGKWITMVNLGKGGGKVWEGKLVAMGEIL